MNNCPNCGKTAVGPYDKLFRTNKLECRHCGTKLQMPSYTNSAVIAAVLLSWLASFIFDFDTSTQLMVGIVVIGLVALGLIVIPLQKKPRQKN